MTHRKVMVAAIVAILLIIACSVVSGCTQPSAAEPIIVTKEVFVPVVTIMKPPEYLYRGEIIATQLPEWFSPTDPRAVVATDAAGVERLKMLISHDHSLQDGWEQWTKR